jgi:TRAP-type mannitol/chloroaromatic compound transport system substrate-binding protein
MDRQRTIKLLLGACIFSIVIGYSTANAADKSVTWKVQSVYKGFSFDEDVRVIKPIEKISGGRIKLEFFQAGEIVNPAEILDAVGKNMIQAGTDFPSYWAGKDVVFDLLATSPVSMSLMDFTLWYYHGNGKTLIQEIYGKYGCMYLPYGLMGPESGFRTNKPINSLEDWKGLKLRTAGFTTGKILQLLGAAPTNIPFAEVYESLQRGVIDGAEFSVPNVDWTVGFHEITKYVCTPSWHQPYAVLGFIMNKKAWDALPDDLKGIIEITLEASMHRYTYDSIYKDAQANKRFLEKGIKMTRMTNTDLDKIEQMKIKIQEELASKNELYAKVMNSQTEFMKSIADYRDALAPYWTPRNPKVYPQAK